jgi:alanine dehydrogenase
MSAYVPGAQGHPERDGPGLVGLKAYTGVGGAVRFAVLLSSAEDGALLAIVEADWLGQVRTGAASGVATRHMARADASTVGLIGTGGQARTQLLAMCAVRPVRRVLVYGRDERRRASFSEEMSALARVEVAPVPSAEEAVRAADIVITATTAREPVLRGAWLRPGAHVNAMGSNWRNRREVDDETLKRSAIVAVDALDQARIEAGDLVIPADAGRFDFARAIELGHIVAGSVAGRDDLTQITLFKSLGLALEDVAVAGLVYTRARERGLGEELSFLP